ncbi:beta-galactosidase [Algibacter sp. AS12]|uniref:beta-galactosidase n=1 Tax=Algibacter sp. AS12 TaxID=3135773 RepID=UPI00398B90BD
MKIFSNKIVVLLLFAIVFNSYNVLAQTLEATALQKINELNALIVTAETSGKEALREKLTVRTAEVFLDYANWDEANITKNTDYFGVTWHYKDNASQMANLLPDFERQDIITMLDSSLVELNKIINDDIIRKPTPNVDWANITISGNKLLHEGKPVFLADWTWKPETSLFQEYHGQLDGYFMTPNYITDDTGTIRVNKLNEINSKPSGKAGFIFINNRNVPQWAIDKYGADFVIKDEKNVRYTEYDIDHPGAKEMMGFLIQGMIPQMSGKNYSKLGYMMCNEPHFINTVEANGNLSWASSGVSNYTIEAFKVWLQNKHTTIANLNTLWGTSFADFDAVTITIPISVTLQGTAKWYDWMSFNMDRVTNWYQFMKDEIIAADPNAKVHLKIIPKFWTNNERTRGIDVEALTRMSGFIGNDTGAVHRSAPWNTEPWEADYIFEWSEMSMAHDFFKSISPNKMMINTESHFLSTKASINLYLNPLHSRATYWLAHTQGLNASQTWFWSRREDGSPRNENDPGYAGSNNHQPRVVNELHATLMDLNAHSEDIAAFQKQRKPIRIFYTKASSVNKPKHMDDVLELYESLSFEGVPLGFVTKDILLNESPSDWDVVLVHKTQFVTQEDKDALQAYINAGGKVIMDNVSFKKDEYNRNTSSLTGSITYTSGAENIKNAALSIVDGFGNTPNVELTETSSAGHPICLWKSVENSSGNQIMSIINTGKVDAQIEINLKNPVNGTTVKDLLKGVDITNIKTLKPYELLFVELRDEDNNLGLNDLNIENDIRLFPNPSLGLVSLHFKKIMGSIKIEVISLDGKNIYNSKHSNTKQLNLDLGFASSGIYIIKVSSEGLSKNFKLIKA